MSQEIRKFTKAGVSTLLCCVFVFTINAYADDNESHLPPGFRSNISIDPNLVIVYENLRGTRNNFNKREIFKILSADEVGNFHLRYNYDSEGRSIGGSLPPALKCDGGYALVNAMLSIQMSSSRSIRTPADTINIDKLKAESPSMRDLTIGMEHLLRREYSKAEPMLLKAIFINLFGKDVGIRKAERYLESTDSRYDIIEEANKQIETMIFSQEEYDRCNSSTESTRLMLAQWGAWALTNTYASKSMEYISEEFDTDIKNVNSLEIAIRGKAGNIRAKNPSEHYTNSTHYKF